LARGGLHPALRSGAAVAHLTGAAIHLGTRPGPSQLGTQVARALYGGVGQSGR
jgi:hypothetical protein